MFKAAQGCLGDVQGCLEVFKAAQSCAWDCHSFLQINELLLQLPSYWLSLEHIPGLS